MTFHKEMITLLKLFAIKNLLWYIEKVILEKTGLMLKDILTSITRIYLLCSAKASGAIRTIEIKTPDRF